MKRRVRWFFYFSSSLFDCNFFSTESLISVIRSNPKDVFMVFCNTIQSCDWTARYLKSHDVTVVKLHGGFSALVNSFYPNLSCSIHFYPSQNRKDILKEFQQGDTKVLVCTDIASRGIHSSHVSWNFQFSMDQLNDCVGESYSTLRLSLKLAGLFASSGKNRTSGV